MTEVISVEKTWQGMKYSKESCQFRLYSNAGIDVKLAIYDDYRDVFRKEYKMEKDGDFFYLELDGDLEGKFYTYILGENEVTDPYSIACSVNSQKSAIIDLELTNPMGFKEHKIPKNPWKEAVIYELHVGDFTVDVSSGVEHRGKFLGMAQANTSYEKLSTGLDHLQDLGVTHVHLLPVYDFISVDEKKNLSEYKDNYNWGYDPELYNCVEGSYATDPYNPKARIYEFKYLVQKIHERGMSVVMDVVYNHTYKTLDSNFNILAPNYYYRNINGNFQNASGCGNEFASEKTIARDFIINSLIYWAKEYKIDGFRFDLMALIDIDTINLAIKKLREINPEIIIYGEPWMAAPSLLDSEKQINIGSQKGYDFAIFNPFYRDSLRGDNDGSIKGYLQGDFRLKKEIEKGIAGSVGLDGLNSNFSKASESINYFNAHDNLIFQDKLIKSGVDAKYHEDITILAFAIVLMSQGLSFFHAGNEFLRDKKLDHNSYSSSADVNGIDWSLKKKHLRVVEVVKELICFRKKSGLFYMDSQEEINENMTFVKGLKDSVIGYIIKKDCNKYLILHNASSNMEKLQLKQGDDVKRIWSNGYKDELVKEFILEPFSSNVYEFKGDIDVLHEKI